MKGLEFLSQIFLQGFLSHRRRGGVKLLSTKMFISISKYKVYRYHGMMEQFTLFPVGWVMVNALLSKGFETSNVCTANCFNIFAQGTLILGTNITQDLFCTLRRLNTINITGSGGKQKGAFMSSSTWEKTLTAAELASKYLEKKGKGILSGVLFVLADVAIKSQSNRPILAQILWK